MANPPPDDLVERLRGLATLLTFAKTKSNAGFDKICEAAADEIERLRRPSPPALEVGAIEAARRIVNIDDGVSDEDHHEYLDAVLVARALLSLSEPVASPKMADAKRIAVDLLESYGPETMVGAVCTALLEREAK